MAGEAQVSSYNINDGSAPFRKHASQLATAQAHLQ